MRHPIGGQRKMDEQAAESERTARQLVARIERDGWGWPQICLLLGPHSKDSGSARPKLLEQLVPRTVFVGRCHIPNSGEARNVVKDVFRGHCRLDLLGSEMGTFIG